jgi:ribosomal protein S7
MAIIYRKTAKGVAEIETRAHRLTPRMRSALILVDGKRSDAELAAMIQQQATETLHALAGQGFIEVLTIASAPAAPAAPVAPVAPATPASKAAAPLRPPAPPAAAAPASAVPDLQARRREAVRGNSCAKGPWV